MRKSISRYVLALLAALFMGSGIAFADTEVRLGDVNGDGTVDEADVVMLTQYLHGIIASPTNPQVADVNQDGSIDIADVTAIKNIMNHQTFDRGTATLADKDGISGATASFTLTVSAVAAAVTTAPAAVSADLTYTGAAQALVTAGAATGGTMKYFVSTISDTPTTETPGWSDAVPTGTDAGTYYIWYYVAADGNHTSTKATVPTAAGRLAGTYTVYYYVKGNGNNNDNGSESAPVGNVSVKIKGIAPSKALDNVTAAEIGWVIGSDGKAYHKTDDNVYPDDVTGVALIFNVGPDNRGLAIALTDCASTYEWGTYGTDEGQSKVTDVATMDADMAGYAYTQAQKAKGYAATAAVNYKAAPANTSGWFLPSAGQWNLFVKYCGYTPIWSSWVGGSDAFTDINKKLTDAGGTALQSTYYWSSSEYSSDFGVLVTFRSSNGVYVVSNSEGSTFRVRPFLAF